MIRTLFCMSILALVVGCGDGNTAKTKASLAAAPQATIGDSMGTLSTQQAKQLFGAKNGPSDQSPAAYGSYAKGCMAGGAQLPETGATWQAMRLSRNRNWGHPETVDYLRRLSARAAQLPGWNGLYIGDMSQPRGGPMLTGHASHQIGLDADIWLRPATNIALSRDARKSLSSISLRRSNGAFTNDKWTAEHHALLKAAASDPRVARIFIFPGAKVQMCNDEKGDRAWLRKIRPWWGHHYHFHVRLSCPRGASGCVNQAAPPPGDGCAEAQGWVDRILNPPPPDPNAPPPRKKRELILADLPAQCAAVLKAQ
ncbi:penicillin-insensitive murein endopeptidase [Phaeobacter sp. J2-8]|uniref:penicillin-insensitive murein endopeptidase n=1 Tax=Phaeobacter sp. J2-8 TaxID=2931394 RepID=UPI001FD483CF|nr:penicillin-insensitive murein endopeptidase [Phaeobacter sp. J2-8]MCJ7874311.1 penicillin-insensitive murein endopeptidase [Phaeobacter sp. J2-8]